MVRLIQRLVLFVMGTVIGTAIGAVVSLLFAPTSGAGLRENARSRLRYLKEESLSAAHARREQLEAELAAMTAYQPPPKNDKKGDESDGETD